MSEQINNNKISDRLSQSTDCTVNANGPSCDFLMVTGHQVAIVLCKKGYLIKFIVIFGDTSSMDTGITFETNVSRERTS